MQAVYLQVSVGLVAPQFGEFWWKMPLFSIIQARPIKAPPFDFKHWLLLNLCLNHVPFKRLSVFFVVYPVWTGSTQGSASPNFHVKSGGFAALATSLTTGNCQWLGNIPIRKWRTANVAHTWTRLEFIPRNIPSQTFIPIKQGHWLLFFPRYETPNACHLKQRISSVVFDNFQRQTKSTWSRVKWHFWRN